jgi:outer membrane lipoprotein carrier protein
MMRHIVAVLFLLLSTTASIAAEPLSGIQSLQRFFNEVRSFTAEFDQVVLDDKNATLQEARGRMWIERPNKFRWNYEVPYKQQIIGDGERLWIYDQDLAQVTVRPLNRGLEDTPALLLAGKRSVEDQFVIRDLGVDNNVAWVQLKPKRRDSSFEEVRLGFERGKFQVFELRDALGQLTRYRLRNVAENVAIDPARFSFAPPKGVDVVEQP